MKLRARQWTDAVTIVVIIVLGAGATLLFTTALGGGMLGVGI